jgi:ankyrin repeat protein
MWAVAEKHSGIARLLLAHGAEVNAASKTGFTALVFAAMKDDGKSVERLLAAGASANYTLPDGTRTLSVAAAYRGASAAIALIDGGAEANVVDSAGNAPLHAAAQLGSLELVKKLLAKGADPDARTARTPEPGRGGSDFRRTTGDETPLLLAARAGHVDVMRALVAGGADPSLKAQDGATLLLAAASSGHLDAVTYAYELDPNAKAVNNRGATVTHYAVSGFEARATQAQICQVVQFLAGKGAPLDTPDARGRTPIAIADAIPLEAVFDLLTRLVIQAGGVPTKSKR